MSSSAKELYDFSQYFIHKKYHLPAFIKNTEGNNYLYTYNLNSIISFEVFKTQKIDFLIYLKQNKENDSIKLPFLSEEILVHIC